MLTPVRGLTMSDLLWEGLNLMAIGMGAVFVFLVLLIFATNLMSSVINRYFPEPELPAVVPSHTGDQPAAVEQTQLLAVITAAIHKHRARQK